MTFKVNVNKVSTSNGKQSLCDLPSAMTLIGWVATVNFMNHASENRLVWMRAGMCPSLSPWLICANSELQLYIEFLTSGAVEGRAGGNVIPTQRACRGLNRQRSSSDTKSCRPKVIVHMLPREKKHRNVYIPHVLLRFYVCDCFRYVFITLGISL